MKSLWNRYDAWLSSNYPDGLHALNEGASEADLRRLEETLGQQLPEDYRMWLAGHNGDKPGGPGMLNGSSFLSTEEVAGQWTTMTSLAEREVGDITTESEPEGHIVPVWWHRNWIPITSDGAGNLECLDLHPGPEGNVGQIIDFDHETVHRTVLAPGFKEWVCEFVDRVVAGEYAYSDDYGLFMPIDEM